MYKHKWNTAFWQKVDKVSHWILVRLYRSVLWLVEHVCYALLKWLWLGITQTIENIWHAFVKALANAFGKVIGYASAIAIVFAFALAFSANEYSLSATFSWQGLQTLWETFR